MLVVNLFGAPGAGKSTGAAYIFSKLKIDKLIASSNTTAEYVNERIEALDAEKRDLKEKIAQLSAELYGKQDIDVIKNYMDKWNDISIQDKITVVDSLIETIHVGHGNVQIKWKI